MKIEAVTFDLWDTVIHDDSDEPIRAQRRMRTKLQERIFLIWQAADSEYDVSLQSVERAYTAVDSQFKRVWHDQFVTWTVNERVQRIFSELDLCLSDRKIENLIDALEYMEIAVPPKPIDGIQKALETLAAQYPLAIVSDAIFTPGKYLKKWLELHDMLQYFSGFAFSDEVGHSKPHPDIFNSAAEQLGANLKNSVHIGDREHNDIEGAHAMGMKAVLFYGTRDADVANTTADAKFNCYTQLPDILNSLVDNSRSK